MLFLEDRPAAIPEHDEIPDIDSKEEAVDKMSDNEHHESPSESAKLRGTKLVVGNWPKSIGMTVITNLFGSHGRLVDTQMMKDSDSVIVEFETYSEAQRAHDALNGLQIGPKAISVTFWNDENRNDGIHENDDLKLNRDRDLNVNRDLNPDLNRDRVSNAEPKGHDHRDDDAGFEHIERSQRSENVEGSETPLASHCAGAIATKSIFEAVENEVNESQNSQSVQVQTDAILKEAHFEEMDGDEKREDFESILHDDGDGNDRKFKKKRSGSVHRRSSSRGIGRNEEEDSDRESSDSESDSLSDSLSTSSSFSSSTDSSRKSKRKKRRKKSDRSQRRLTRKERAKRKRRRRRERSRRRKRKLREREKRVDHRVEALTDCLEKFTNLMASVSQSAMLMQQSVAAMSQMRDQSMIYGQSVGTHRVLPNQPLYTSFIPSFQGAAGTDAVTPMGPGTNANDNAKDGQNEDSKPNSASMSMLEVINQMSNTQGGPGGAAVTPTALNSNGRRQSQPVVPAINVMSSPIAAEQERLIQQQQQLLALQQQALQLRAQQTQRTQPNQQQQQQPVNGGRATNWVNANYAKPVLINNGKSDRGAVSSSPILHSTQHSSPTAQQQQQQQQPVLSMLNGGNLTGSGCSGTNEQQPGTLPAQQSKSKIFEHKKALRNVSPEMDQKLKELNAMGYTNRTFNLVLLKQENGDLPKVIENLKQFYSNNQ